MEERLEDSESHKVKYSTRNECVFSLNIPMELAINKKEVADYEAKKVAVEALGRKWCAQYSRKFYTKHTLRSLLFFVRDSETVRSIVTFDAGLQMFGAQEEVADYRSPVTGNMGKASK